jgi:mannose-6-phosphate isomerase-like protein (cupin superfamily)
VPFTLRNIKEDLEDIGPRFDGAPDLEFRAATKALELEKSALSYQRVPPGYRFPYGHTHETQEEVYVVLRGSGRMKLDDEIVELKEWDAVRVPPGTWRGYEAGPKGLEILVIGAPNLSGRLGAKTSMASATGGLMSRPVRKPFGCASVR